MAEKYILKDGKEVELIPIGKSSVKIEEKSPDGLLTVIGRIKNPDETSHYQGAIVLCRCVCGNYTAVRLQNFREGTTKSCGCYGRKQKRKLCKKIGQQSHEKDYSKINNPFYTFISPTSQMKNKMRVWKIKCKKCGKEYNAIPSQIISDTRRKGSSPCNCWKNVSKGELKIEQLLLDNNIDFEKQKTFCDCLSEKNNKLRFDFYVKNKYLIEFDGEQHSLPMSFGDHNGGEEKLKLNIINDNIKNNYCVKNNIPLIRIPYTHYNNLCIEDLLLETSNFIYKGEVNE